VVPGLGQLDDITILLVGAKIFIELAPKDVVANYLGRISSVGEAGKPAGKSSDSGETTQSEDDVIEGIIIEDDDNNQ
jgi:hypothetical protein